MNLDALKNLNLPPIVHKFSERDTMLYALGLGYGDNPVSPHQLQFVYEERLKTVPSISVVLAHPGFWIRDPMFGVDWLKLLHGEQSFHLHAPIPSSGAVVGEYEITAIEDKGIEKGAVLHLEKVLYSEGSRRRLATVQSVLFLRGDGGQGGFGNPPHSPVPFPDGNIEQTIELQTLPQAALIYRLSGDLNPIHVDPAIALEAGFERPILHGLCTMGFATRALLEVYAPEHPEMLESVFVRFSKPVYPGEMVRFEFIRKESTVRFRAIVPARNTLVLDRGTAVFRNSPYPTGTQT